MPTLDHALRSVDEAFVAVAREKAIPGVAWGVISGGRLAHSGGTGVVRDGEPTTPDSGTVYRIASMTKSFTAAAILLLRDEGRLRLDDPVADHVRALASWSAPSRDAAPITIRQLLTMAAGLPTDDPWADRQQALPIDAFEELLSAGPVFAWPPDTAFEYSNLGYGILGRVVTAAADREYRDVVRDRLMAPLGMTSSGYGEEDVPGERLAHGYLRVEDRLEREGADGYGAMAAMGGVYSSVSDLARWVAGFLDAFPARDDADEVHPLRRSARREMQQAHRMWPMAVDDHAAHARPGLEAGGYGYGLFNISRLDVGTIVGHGGGYPGYGSQMVWHPATGLGVVAAGNLRYAGVHAVAIDQLVALVRADTAPRRALRPLPELTAAVDAAGALLEGWDDALADEWFAMNMDLDDARERRRAAIERAVADVGGPLRPDPAREVGMASPAHRRWWLRGQRGWIDVGLRLSPEPNPKIQALRVTPVLDPPARLVDARDRLLAAARAGTWPAALEATAAVDTGVAMRGLRVLAALFDPLDASAVVAGDGRLTATWELGPRAGGATIRVDIDGETGRISAVAPRIAAREAPTEAW